MTTAPVVLQTRPTPNGGRAGLLALTAWTELRASLRAPEFAAGAIGIPLLLYGMFGLTNADQTLPGGTSVGLAMLVSMCAYGTISLAIFVFGEDVARERGRGWTRTMRATPLPTTVHLLGKVANAVVIAAMIVVAMCLLAALAGGITLGVGEWLALGATGVAATVVFAPLGFAIAYAVRPRAAAVISNLVFLPLSFASGFFIPLGELPTVLQRIADYLPTFHFAQLWYRIVMPDGDVELWTGASTRPLWVHVAWVVGAAVVLGAVALVAARREAVSRRS